MVSVAEVRVLGVIGTVAADGAVRVLPSASQRRLLGLLAIHAPRPLRGEWLADALDLSPGALRTSISRLRATVGGDAIQSTGAGYSVTTRVDADRFSRAVAAIPAGGPERLEALEAALALWAGPPLEEFAAEPWAEGEASRLTEEHARTVDDHAEALIAAGAAEAAVARLDAQVAAHPYRDRSRGLLIRALAASGRRAEALRAFQAYRTRLVEELGIDPSADVVRIERRVATGWDGTDGPTAPPEDTDGRAASPGRRFAAPWPAELPQTATFVGRDEELDALRAALDRAGEGELAVVAITGEAGIGKTMLLAAFAREVQARRAAALLHGRCDQAPVPLQPVRAVLSAIVDHASADLLAAHVARCGGELGRIVPRLGVRVPTAPAATATDDATAQYLAFEAAADLVRRVAEERALVLLLDDLQWAEPTALVLLRRLVRSLASSPILVVTTIRATGATVADELRRTVVDLDPGRVVRLPLDGLAPDALAELVTGQTEAAVEAGDVAAALHRDTAGHPLYASQLLRHWLESGRLGASAEGSAPELDLVPPDLREVVTLRVEALGPEVAQVLRTASVLGTAFAEDALVEVESLPEATVAEALDAATGAGLLEPAPSVRRWHRFTHALVAHALTASLGPARRARVHGRAVRALEKGGDGSSTDTVVALARHALLAGWPAEAQHWSALAGDRALAGLAATEAAGHYRTAVDLAEEQGRPEAERADLLVRLGDAQHRAGDGAALVTLEDAGRLARRVGDGPTLARAALAADRGFVRLDARAVDHLALVDAALEVTDPDDRSTRARLLALRAQCLVYQPAADARSEAAEAALALATEVGDTTLLAQVGPGIQWGLIAPGQAGRRGRVARDTIAAAEATGDPRLLFAAHHSGYNVAVETADPVAASRSLATMHALARAVDEPRLHWVVGLYDTFVATMAGRLADAEAIAATTWELGLEIGAPDATTLFAGQMFVSGTFAGRHEELFPLVDQAARDNPDVMAFVLARAICCAAAGRPEEARTVLDEGRRRGFGAVPADNLWTTTVLGYAVLAIELEVVDAAGLLLPLIEPVADAVAFNGVTSQGPIAAYVGKLSSLLGRPDDAEHHLRSALAIADAFGWTYHRATTLIALAQARHRSLGRLDEDCEHWLAEAEASCAAHGFRSWSAQVAALRATA